MVAESRKRKPLGWCGGLKRNTPHRLIYTGSLAPSFMALLRKVVDPLKGVTLLDNTDHQVGFSIL